MARVREANAEKSGCRYLLIYGNLTVLYAELKKNSYSETFWKRFSHHMFTCTWSVTKISGELSGSATCNMTFLNCTYRLWLIWDNN